jgi:hypothetical protein
MFLFTILTFVTLWLQPSERKDNDEVRQEGLFFRNQVAAAGRAAYSYNSALDDYLVKIQQCHIGSKNGPVGESAEINGTNRPG